VRPSGGGIGLRKSHDFRYLSIRSSSRSEGRETFGRWHRPPKVSRLSLRFPSLPTPSQQTQPAQRLQNALNLLLTLFVRFAKGGGESGGIGAELGNELFNKGDLFGQFGGPGLGDRGRKSHDLRYIYVETVEGGLVGFFLFSLLGILILGPQPADEAAFLFGGALVIEGDEAGEELLLEGLGFGSADAVVLKELNNCLYKIHNGRN